MKNYKRVLALLLALVMVFSLAACGKKTDGGKDNPTQGEKGTEPGKTGENEKDAGKEETDKVKNYADAETLTVAAPELNGNYINGFGNSTYDVWIKNLIGNYENGLSYATYYYDASAEWKLNPTVVKGEPKATKNADGSKTFEFTIADNLVWNNGEKITAKDYAFTYFFNAAPEWTATGSLSGVIGENLVGYAEYHAGKTREFKGVKVIDDKKFSLTIAKEKLPYFYEKALLATIPTPMKRYTPNLDIKGSTLAVKEGYKVTEEDKKLLIDGQQKKVDDLKKTFEADKAALKAQDDENKDKKEYKPVMPLLEAKLKEDYKAWYEKVTAKDYKGEEVNGDLLSMIAEKVKIDAEEAKLKGYKDGSTKLDPINLLMAANTNEVAFTYRFKPDVTCGPYKFESFGNGMAKVTLNDKFVGDENGNKPTIKNVIVQTVNSKIDVDLVLSGKIDIAAGVIEGEKIEKAKKSDKADVTSYARNGYGLMPILCDMGATKYKGVRQAIAFSLDRTEFVQNITGGYGVVVNGAYGQAMWEFKEYESKNGGTIEDELIQYTRNNEKANEALDKNSPYKFEKDGKTPWDAKKALDAYNKDKENFNYWRYDEKGKQLRVIHEGITDVEVSTLISNQLPDETKKVGMQYIVNMVDFATMLNHQYYPDAKNPNQPTVFNLAIGFSVPNDPYYQYHSSQIGADNTYRVNDKELDKLLENMRRLNPDQRDKWLADWVKFEKWFNDYVPNIPLYSNEYYDIFTARVKGMKTTPFRDWSSIICTLSLEK